MPNRTVLSPRRERPSDQNLKGQPSLGSQLQVQRSCNNSHFLRLNRVAERIPIGFKQRLKLHNDITELPVILPLFTIEYHREAEIGLILLSS